MEKRIKRILSITLSVLVSTLLVAGVAMAVTTISENIATGGTLTVTGASTLTDDLAVNGGDLTTTATTFNLLNATAITLNLGGAATTIGIGASTAITTFGGKIVLSPTFTAAGSDQSVEADATLDVFTGGYGGGVMGHVMGTVAAGDSIVGGLIGKYNVATNPSDEPAGAVLGEVGEDSAGTLDGAFVAYIGGDSGVVTAPAAYTVRSLNSTSGAGFAYGLDLSTTTVTGYLPLSFSAADIRLYDGSTIDTGSIDGTTLRSIVITPKASATTSSISHHELVRIPMTFGDPDHRTYGLVLNGNRSGAAGATFDGTDTTLDVRMTNAVANDAAYDMQGMYIKTRNSIGGTSGSVTGAKIEVDSQSGSTSTTIHGLDVYVSQDSSTPTEVVGIRIYDDNQDGTGTNYGLLMDGGYTGIAREYGIYLNSVTGSSWTNGITFDGTLTNVLDFAEADGTNGAKAGVGTITVPGTTSAMIKIDIAGTTYYIPAYNAAALSAGTW